MAAMYRHGDVLLILRDDETCDLTDDTESELVVAEGEMTGHAHRVRGRGVRLRDHGHGRIRLAIAHGARIVHEEHHAITLPPGVYEVRHQRTMSQPGVWDRVAD